MSSFCVHKAPCNSGCKGPRGGDCLWKGGGWPPSFWLIGLNTFLWKGFQIKSVKIWKSSPVWMNYSPLLVHKVTTKGSNYRSIFLLFVEMKCSIPAPNFQQFLCLNSDNCINSWFYCFYLFFFTFAHIYVAVQTRRLVDRVIYWSCTGRQYTRILATANINSGRLWKHFLASDKVFTIPYIICVNFRHGSTNYKVQMSDLSESSVVQAQHEAPPGKAAQYPWHVLWPLFSCLAQTQGPAHCFSAPAR